MNLAEVPFCYPSKMLPQNLKEIIWERVEIDKSGERVKRRITVRYPTTEMGERVYLGLMGISKEESFPQVVPFSVYRLLGILKMENCGKRFKEIRQALTELHEVSIYTQEAFWDNKQKRYISTSEEGFHIIDRWRIKERGEKEEGYFKWNDVIYNSIIQNGYVKNLNLKFYLQLESPVSRRLYRYLDKRMYNCSTFKIKVFELAKILGLVNYECLSLLRRRLDPALEELKGAGYLQYEYKENFEKIRFIKPKMLPQPKESEQEFAGDDGFVGRVSREFRMKGKLVKELVEEHGLERVERAYKYAKENGNKNPGGLFLSALKEGYELEGMDLDLEKVKRLKLEAEKCYKMCFGNCPADFDRAKEERGWKACFWCVKFADIRRRETSEREEIKVYK